MSSTGYAMSSKLNYYDLFMFVQLIAITKFSTTDVLKSSLQ